VIQNSFPWKRELGRLVARIRRTKQMCLDDKSSFKLERDTFYAVYAIRKLVEAFKVSDEVEALCIEAIEYMPRGDMPDILNKEHIGELYDLSQGRSCRISLKDFCNQFIHSFIFLPCEDEERSEVIGLFVASDYRKLRGLLYFDFDQIVGLLSAVSHDDIWHAEYRRDPVTMEMKVVKKLSNPPGGIIEREDPTTPKS
jgi:hypothetical protein